MNNKYFALVLAPAIALTIATGADARFGGGERLQNVDKQIEKIDNGVIRTLTATDADTIAKLQEMASKRADKNDDNESYSIVNLSNGVQITNISDDAGEVAKMHERADNPDQGRGGLHGKGGERGEKLEAEKTITNLDNGVQITMTSDDAEVVTKLQEKEPRAPKNEAVSVSKTNLSNGVQITVTTTNAELVEKIQSRAEKKGKGKKRGGKGRGQRGGETSQ